MLRSEHELLGATGSKGATVEVALAAQDSVFRRSAESTGTRWSALPCFRIRPGWTDARSALSSEPVASYAWLCRPRLRTASSRDIGAAVTPRR
jgi:hypothetical protein